jgi:RHS repeat-associated protein
VTFNDGATVLGTGTIAAGQASLATSFATVGAHSLTAVYGGDANNLGSTSAVVNMTIAADVITYYHNDISGTPLAETDATGNLLWKESYRPYGDPVQPPSTDNKLWFTGKPYDKDIGLTHLGARYYDPLVGRFMGMDPKWFDPSNIHSFNRYAYANNNPEKFVDPDGKSPLLLVREGVLFYEAATALGAPVLGGLIAEGVWNLTHQSSTEGGAKEAPEVKNPAPSDEWIYGPKDDPQIYPDGSTRPNTWTTPDNFPTAGEATDKLDPFKPVEGRRPVNVPEGIGVKRGKTPGGEGGDKDRSGGANETLIPGGLPPGSAGTWEPLP